MDSPAKGELAFVGIFWIPDFSGMPAAGRHEGCPSRSTNKAVNLGCFAVDLAPTGKPRQTCYTELSGQNSPF